MTHQTHGNPAELFQRWFNINQELLKASLKALETLGKDPMHLDDVYREQLQSAREAVRRTLELEREAADAIEKQAGGTLPANGLAELTSSMTRSGIDLRAHLWEAWFDQAESLGTGLSRNLVRGLDSLTAQGSSSKATDGASAQAAAGAETSPGSDGGKQNPQSKAASATR